jgi:hypothetical protein
MCARKPKKAALRDYANEINANSLVNDVETFQAQLDARGNSVKARIAFLKDQFHARISGEEPRVYTTMGPEFRTKYGKLRLTSQSKDMTEEAYLTSLLHAMIEEDGAAIGLNANKGKRYSYTSPHPQPNHIPNPYMNPTRIRIHNKS